MTESQPLYLASRSPRRRELLEQVGIEYQLLDIDIDESVQAGELPQDYVLRLATAKARHALLGAQDDEALVLAADTTVAIDQRILGKPRDANDAAQMLHALSARTHQVFTAVALASKDAASGAISSTSALSENHVSFRALNAHEIAEYIATGEPMDKAGAYAIQGRAAVFVEHLVGSYSGVMGLPLFEVSQLLQQARR